MKRKHNKHDKLTKDLESRLKSKPYVSFVKTHKEYKLGECDIFSIQDYGTVYYEIKSNFNKKSYNKALIQLLRWSGYMYYIFPERDYYGIYWTPTKFELMAKNGKMFNNIKNC